MAAAVLAASVAGAKECPPGSVEVRRVPQGNHFKIICEAIPEPPKPPEPVKPPVAKKPTAARRPDPESIPAHTPADWKAAVKEMEVTGQTPSELVSLGLQWGTPDDFEKVVACVERKLEVRYGKTRASLVGHGGLMLPLYNVLSSRFPSKGTAAFTVAGTAVKYFVIRTVSATAVVSLSVGMGVGTAWASYLQIQPLIECRKESR